MFLFGVRVDNIDSTMALNMVRAFASHKVGFGPTRKVFFTNVHSIHMARRDRELMRILNRADLVLPDGSGIMLAGKLFGQPILENINGTDFTPRVLEYASREHWSIYLLGARPEVNTACRNRIQRDFPGLKIVGARHGLFGESDEQRIVDDINEKQPHLLLVALGTPLQEKWIARNADKLRVGTCMAVGGLFDFVSGDKSRAPSWLRRLGMEWLYRFFQDPAAKWYRVFVEIPFFIGLVIAKRIIPIKLRAMVQRRFISYES